MANSPFQVRHGLVVNNTVLVANTTTGNVGIGTSNPQYTLDVAGDARITGNLTLGDSSTDTITVNAANFSLANNVSFDSGTLYIDKNNDRVGIGTTAPTALLQVAGSGRVANFGSNALAATTFIRINPSSGFVDFGVGVGNDGIYTGSSDNESYIRCQSGKFTILDSTNPVLAIRSNYVGIGTTSPTAKLDVAAGTSTSNTTSLVNLTQTWNNSGNTFTAIKTNITNTASASGSKLIDLQLNGNTRFSVLSSSSGSTVLNGSSITFYPYDDPSFAGFNSRISHEGNETIAFTPYNTFIMAMSAVDRNPNVQINRDKSFGWSDTTGMSAAGDLRLWRDAAGTLAQRNGAAGQTYRIYGTYTDASNYERAVFGWPTANTLSIGTEAAGTGTVRNISFTGGNVAIGTTTVSGSGNKILSIKGSGADDSSGASISLANPINSGNISTLGTIDFKSLFDTTMASISGTGQASGTTAALNFSLVASQGGSLQRYMSLTPGGLALGTPSLNSSLTVYNTSYTNETIAARLCNAQSGSGSSSAMAFNSVAGNSSSYDYAKIAGVHVGYWADSAPYGDIAFSVANGSTTLNERMRITASGNVGIANTNPQATLHVAGTALITGNVTINGINSGYAPNRPAFRVYGSGTTNNLTTTQNGTGCLTSNNWTVDINTGTYLSNTNGVFTAPVTGIYQVNVVGRNSGYTSGISQLAVTKNGTSGGTVGGTCVLMIEWAASSTMNHAGGSTSLLLNTGDTLALKVLAGEINFDGNDNWSVVYIG